MKRFRRPLFLIGFSIVCGALAMSASLTASAQTKRKLVQKEGKPVQEFASQAAAPIVVEDFSYGTGDLAIVGAGNGWVVHSGTTNPINVVSPGLTFSGYASSDIGNAVSTAATGIDMSRQFPAVGSGSIYTAFTISVSNSTTTGDYIFHYLTFGSTSFFRGRVFVRKDASTSNFAFGLSRASGDIAYTPNSYTPGTTYLVVVKYTFVAGATNDTVELFINPTPGGTEPSAILSAPADVANGDPTNLDAIALRQGGTTSGSTQVIDGVRIASNWADAVASSAGSTPRKPNVDMNGDGRTDYVIVRPPGGSGFAATKGSQLRLSERERLRTRVRAFQEGLASAAVADTDWWIRTSDDGHQESTYRWGDFSTDDPVTADFDGDGKDDIAVWRPAELGEQAYFYSIDSSNFAFRSQPFGQLGDNAYAVGDYDGDGIDDAAVYRCPIGSAGSCYYFYRASSNNPTGGIHYIPIGYGEGDGFDYLPYQADFNGDGKQDFVIQGAASWNPDLGIFVWYVNGSTTIQWVQWGLYTDRLVPGDFDGDGLSDITVTREVNGALHWYVRKQSGGSQFVRWGLASDLQAPGDYDGDGQDDFAVYRWNDTDATFWVLPSSGSAFNVRWGLPGDYPLSYLFVQ